MALSCSRSSAGARPPQGARLGARNSDARPFVRRGLSLFIISLPLLNATGRAQIAVDGSLGPTPSLTGPNYAIPAELGRIEGRNLFHSFSQFNVLDGQSATFTGPGSISNVVSRVTGSLPSTIDGLLDSRTSMPSANFFLLNPNGIVIGPNAELNVGGSFHASTADYLRFADNTRFFATLSKESSLTVADPVAFGFLGTVQGSVAVQGSQLSFGAGTALSLASAQIRIGDAALLAPGGRIQLQGAAAGEVPIDAAASALSGAGGTIDIMRSVIDASGAPPGTVVIRGGQLLVAEGTSIISQSTADAAGPAVGIDLQVSDHITLAGGAVLVASNSGMAAGNAIKIAAQQLILAEGASIESSADGAGRGADIQIVADELTADSVRIASSTFGEGAGGDVQIVAGSASLSFTVVATHTSGGARGGAISMSASDVLELVVSEISSQASHGVGGDLRLSAGAARFESTGLVTQASGDAVGGGITIDAESVSVSLSSISTTKMDAGAGHGGDVFIRSSGTLAISASEVFGMALTGGVGGALDINARELLITDNSTVLSLSDGQGSPISIEAGQLSLVAGALVSSSSSSEATAGLLTVNAGSALIADPGSGLFTAPGKSGGDLLANFGTLTLTRGASIQAGSFAGRRGGNMTVLAQSLEISELAGISSQAFTEDVGPLTIQAGNLLIDQGFISTSTLDVGQAGSISLDVGSLVLANGGQIASSSIDPATGNGGDISVTAKQFVTISGVSPSSESPIPALFRPPHADASSGIFSTASSLSAEAGSGGTITVVTPTLALTDGGKLSVATIGPGAAGSITLDVDTLTVEDGARIASNTSGPGNAGSIFVAGAKVALSNTGRIDSGTTGAGRGGTITLQLDDSLTVGQSGAISSDAGGTGPGGDINITSPGIELSTGGSISARSTGSDLALAGSINVTFGDTLRMDSASITTESLRADGGNIVILSTGSTLQILGGQITTSVQSESGAGGNITLGSSLHPLDLVLLKDSQILANAFGGPGGNIAIFADAFLTSGSPVEASSALSTPGSVNVNARITDLSGSLSQLPTETLQAADLLRAACRARTAEGKASSLVVSGREGTPPQPDGLLWSPLDELGTDVALLPEGDGGPLFPLLAGAWLASDCAR